MRWFLLWQPNQTKLLLKNGLHHIIRKNYRESGKKVTKHSGRKIVKNNFGSKLAYLGPISDLFTSWLLALCFLVAIYPYGSSLSNSIFPCHRNINVWFPLSNSHCCHFSNKNHFFFYLSVVFAFLWMDSGDTIIIVTYLLGFDNGISIIENMNT